MTTTVAEQLRKFVRRVGGVDRLVEELAREEAAEAEKNTAQKREHLVSRLAELDRESHERLPALRERQRALADGWREWNARGRLAEDKRRRAELEAANKELISAESVIGDQRTDAIRQLRETFPHEAHLAAFIEAKRDELRLLVASTMTRHSPTAPRHKRFKGGGLAEEDLIEFVCSTASFNDRVSDLRRVIGAAADLRIRDLSEAELSKALSTLARSVRPLEDERYRRVDGSSNFKRVA
jgi:hypothetical protein